MGSIFIMKNRNIILILVVLSFSCFLGIVKLFIDLDIPDRQVYVNIKALIEMLIADLKEDLKKKLLATLCTI